MRRSTRAASPGAAIAALLLAVPALADLGDRPVAVVVGLAPGVSAELGERIAQAVAQAADEQPGVTVPRVSVAGDLGQALLDCGDDPLCQLQAAREAVAASQILAALVTPDRRRRSALILRLVDVPAQEVSSPREIRLSTRGSLPERKLAKALAGLTRELRRDLIQAAELAARRAHLSRDRAATRAAAERLHDLHPDSGWAAFYLAELRFAEAPAAADLAAQYRHALRSGVDRPARATCLHRLGTLAERAGEEPEAADLYRRSLRLGRRDHEVRRSLGLVLSRLGHQTRARRYLLDAWSRDVRDAEVNLALGRIAHRQRDPAAGQYLGVAAAAGVGGGEPEALLADLALRAEPPRPDEARQRFERAIAAGYREPRALLRLGRMQLAAGDDDQAAVTLRAALERRARDPELPFLLAELALAQGDPDTAASHFRRSYRDGVHKAESAEQLGTIAAAAGEHDDARRYHRAAYHLGRTSPVVLKTLARAAIEDRLPRKARMLLERLLAQTPADAEARLLLGRILLEARRPAEALPHLTAAAAAGFEPAESHRLAGQAAEQRRDHAAAREHYHAALNAGADDPAVRVALARLQLGAGETASAIQLLTDPDTGAPEGSLACEIELRILDREQGKILLTDRYSGPLDKLLDLPAELARLIGRALQQDPTTSP